MIRRIELAILALCLLLCLLCAACSCSFDSGAGGRQSAAQPELPIGRKELQSATTTAFAEGPTVDREGNVYFTDMTTGEIEAPAERFEGKRLNQPNEVAFDGKGRLYFSDRPRRKRPVRANA